MVARKIERFIPPFEKLYLPPLMEELCKFDQGMVLLAGSDGVRKKYDHRVDAGLDQSQHE